MRKRRVRKRIIIVIIIGVILGLLVSGSYYLYANFFLLKSVEKIVKFM